MYISLEMYISLGLTQRYISPSRCISPSGSRRDTAERQPRRDPGCTSPPPPPRRSCSWAFSAHREVHARGECRLTPPAASRSPRPRRGAPRLALLPAQHRPRHPPLPSLLPHHSSRLVSSRPAPPPAPPPPTLSALRAGHYLGLDVHDTPLASQSQPLLPGMAPHPLERFGGLVCLSLLTRPPLSGPRR